MRPQQIDIQNESIQRTVDKRHCRQGFTIIELLLLITMLTVLIAILLPAMSQAREVSAQVICEANMRETTMITLAYADENRQYLPYGTQNTATPYSVSSPNHPQWNNMINAYDSVPANATVSNAKYGRLRRCPGAVNFAYNSNTHVVGTTFYNSGADKSIVAENTRFHAPNAFWIVRDDQSAAGTPKRLDQIKKKVNQCMAVVDQGTSANPNQEPTFAGGFPPDGGVRWRHGSGTSINLGFLDGHAENWTFSAVWAARQLNMANLTKFDPKDLLIGNSNAHYPWADTAE